MNTYLLDTNQILRLVIKDEPKQYQEILSLVNQQLEGEARLIFEIPVFFELQWVLLQFYDQSKAELIFIIESILEMNVFEIFQLDTFKSAFQIYKQHNLDLEDCYFMQIALQNNYIFTSFDKKALKVYQQLQP
jgi:predicted nucleic acid-binding protein